MAATDLPAKFETILEQEKPSILERIPKLNEWMTPERWWAVNYELLKNDKLRKVAEVNPYSLINALKKLAEWGLEADGEEAFINVYGNEAQAQAMYKGLIRRAIEAGIVAHVVADVIKEGDQIEIISSTRGRELVHRPAFGTNGGKRPIIGAYALFTLPSGQADYELMEASDLDDIKATALRMAQRYDKNATLSPAWRFFEGEQSKKSVIRRGLKRMRGARPDTVAGKSFADMMADLKQAEEPPEPDDIPTAKGEVRQVKAELVPDPPKQDRLITDGEIDDIFEQGVSLGMKRSQIVKLLSTWSDGKLSDFAEMKLSQLVDFTKALAEAAS